MANSKFKATAELFLDTSNAKNDAKKFVANLKQQLSSIETAADKMNVFKELVGYIGQVDNALTALRTKNGDAFKHMFDGMDENFRKQFEDLFELSGDNLQRLDVLREKLATLTPKSGIAEIRKFATELNKLFTSIGAGAPLNIDEFKNKATQGQIDNITSALGNFEDKWVEMVSRLKDGFSLGPGGVGEAVQRTTESIQAEFDTLESKMNELGEIQKKFRKSIEDMRKYNETGNIFPSDTKFTFEEAKDAIKEFLKVKKEVEDFKGNKKSIEYFEILSKYMQQSVKIANMYNNITGDKTTAIYKQMQQKKISRNSGEQETYISLLGRMSKFARRTLDSSMFDSLINYSDSIDDQIAQICARMTLLEDELEKIKPITENAGSGIAKIGSHVVNTTEYIRGMTIAMKEMFDVLSKASDTEYKVLIGGQDISIKRGQYKEISGKTTAEAYLANIMQDTDVDAHSHMGITSNINAPDFLQAIKRYYSGIAKISAVIGRDDIVTLDLAKVKAEDAYVALEKLKELTSNKGNESINIEDFNKMMQEINPEYTDVAQKWTPSQFDDLAKKIFGIKQNAQQAISPVEKFKNILISMSGKDIDFSKYNDLLETLSVDNVGDIFNQIAKAEGIMEDGKFLQVEDISAGNIQSVIADIQQQKDAYASLRETAGVTYDEIAKAAKEYYQIFNKSEGQDFEFFKKYFHPSEIAEIQQKFMDVGDGLRDLDGLTRELAMNFGIDFDDMPVTAFQRIGDTAQEVSNQLKVFFDLVDEIRHKSFNVADNADDNLEIGEYVERLNSAKAILDEFGNQNQLTAEQMNQVNDAFNTANTFLTNSAVHYNGYVGGRYDYSYYEEYSDALKENDELRRYNTELESRLNNVSNSTDDSIINNSVQTEVAQLNTLLEKINEVKTAIDAKTNAFREEAGVVDLSIKQEVTSLENLKTYLELLKTTAQSIFSGNKKKIGFHYGNLDHYVQTGDKSENFKYQGDSLRTGNWSSFGTGIYYLSDPSAFMGSSNVPQGQLKNNKFYAMDLSKYNLYTAQTSEQAENLYNFLNKLQKFVMSASNYRGFDKELQGVNVESLYKEFQTVFKNVSLPIEALQNFIDRMRGLVAGLDIDKNFATFDNVDEVLGRSDNIPTRFMKSLGYQGIDVSGTSWDKLQHGNVVYDLDQTNAYYQTFDSLAELLEYYNQNLTHTNSIQDTINASVTQWQNGLETIKQTIESVSTSIQESSSSMQSMADQLSEMVTNAQTLKNNLDGINATDAANTNRSTVPEKAKVPSEVSGRFTKSVPIDDTASSMGVADETAQLNNLLLIINQVKEAVDAKTKAFKEEYVTVDAAVEAEIDALNKLKILLDDIKGSMQLIFSADVQKLGDINTKQNETSEKSAYGALQSISEVLGQIYGVLKGFTGIDAKTENSVDVKKPVDETRLNHDKFIEQDLPALNSILDAVNGINSYLVSSKSDTISDGFDDEQNDTGYALEATLQNVVSILGNILVSIPGDDALLVLVQPLTDAVAALKNVADGIIQHQKAQKSDTRVAQARLEDPAQQDLIRQKATDVGLKLGSEAKIATLDALGDGLVRVSGAFKDVNGEWKGFIVNVNEANEAVKLGIKGQTAFAKSLNGTFKQGTDNDENPHIYNRDDVEARAKKHLDEYAAQGKNATVQFKDSGRYTITILEEIDGLSKQIFQTFDENDDKIERTTVTMSNSQKMKLDALQKKLIEDGVSNGLVSDKNQIYVDYQKASDELSNMTDAYSKLDDVSDDQISKWKQQIALVQQLGSQLTDLIKQNKLESGKNIFESDRSKKLSKFDLDNAKLQKDINIPDGFKSQIDKARKAIEVAADSDALKVAINNWESLKNKINETAVQQDLYIKKTNAAPDRFSKDLSVQEVAFDKYKKGIEGALGVTDELKTKIQALETELKSVNDGASLSEWQKKFADLQNEIGNAQWRTKRDKTEQSRRVKGELNSKLKGAGLNRQIENPNVDQQEILDKRDELLRQLGEYNMKIGSWQQAEISGIEQTKTALFGLIDAYKQKNNIVNANGNPSKQAYGTAQLLNQDAKYNSLVSRAQGVDLTGDFDAVKKLTDAYERLKKAQSKFQVGEDLTTEFGKAKVESFKRAQIEFNRYAQELNKVVKEEEKLKSNAADSNLASVTEDFQNTLQGRKKALEDFVNSIPDAAIGKFNNDFTSLTYTVKNGDGTFTNMTATLNAARTAIYSTAGETEKATGAFGKFFSGIKSKAAELSRYIISMAGIQEIWQQIRKGVQYVKEIDSALTELKKVTNETSDTYNKFLQNMSSVAGEIGSTTSNLTKSAADWARLGYSIEDAGELAKNTAILMNVSEFDNVNDATEALISSLQAYGYEASNSIEVVDKLNIVGNNFAISSDGIASGLQRSASTLVAAGNSLEQSIAMLAAGNKVIQDPEALGKSIAENKNSYIG